MFMKRETSKSSIAYQTQGSIIWNDIDWLWWKKIPTLKHRLIYKKTQGGDNLDQRCIFLEILIFTPW